eukprot:755974-Hanusia_phi.AAC.1
MTESTSPPAQIVSLSNPWKEGSQASQSVDSTKLDEVLERQKKQQENVDVVLKRYAGAEGERRNLMQLSQSPGARAAYKQEPSFSAGEPQESGQGAERPHRSDPEAVASPEEVLLRHQLTCLASLVVTEQQLSPARERTMKRSCSESTRSRLLERLPARRTRIPPSELCLRYETASGPQGVGLVKQLVAIKPLGAGLEWGHHPSVFA